MGGAAGMARAAELLRAGGTVAFPTETVYGLGANALDAAAVAKIFAAKQRPGWDPLIVHVEGAAMLERVAAVPPELREQARGADGRVLARAADAAAAAHGGGAGCGDGGAAAGGGAHAGASGGAGADPAWRVCRWRRRAPIVLAAPSPTTAAHVLADLDGRIDAVLDGGPAKVGVESTVLDLAARAIYRPGAVTAAMISRVIGDEVAVVTCGEADMEIRTPLLEALPSPGMGMRHYAPQARLVLVESQQQMLDEIAKHPCG